MNNPTTTEMAKDGIIRFKRFAPEMYGKLSKLQYPDAVTIPEIKIIGYVR